MDKKEIKKFLINKNSCVKKAMGIIEQNGFGVVFVIDDSNRIVGVVSDGDIRRAILAGVDVEEPIEEISNKEPLAIIKENGFYKLNKKVDNLPGFHKISGVLAVPVIDDSYNVLDIKFFNCDRLKNLTFGGTLFFAEDKKIKEKVKKVLLIGGAGYLGSVLSKKLLGLNYKVRVMDNLIFGDSGIKEFYSNKNFELIKGDIKNIPDIIKAVDGVDVVIHLAAIVGDPACAKDAKETLQTNYLATKNIIEACKLLQINRFIFASTCSVYGENSHNGEKLTEQSSLNPVSLYAETKIKCEKSILKSIGDNFSPTILRMATLYGYSPNMRFDLVANLFAATAFFEKRINIFGGTQWRPWLSLEDAAEAYIKCLKSPIGLVKGKIFNVLSENHTVNDIGEIVKSVFPGTEIKTEDKLMDKRNYIVSFEKIKNELGFEPKTKVEKELGEIKKIFQRGEIKDYKDPVYRASLPQI